MSQETRVRHDRASDALSSPYPLRIVRYLCNRNAVLLFLFHVMATVGWAGEDRPRNHGMDRFLSIINGDAIPDSGFVRVTLRQFVAIHAGSDGFIVFVPRDDGGYRETRYESGWRGDDYFRKEVTDPGVPFSTNLKTGRTGDLGWDEFNNDLHIHSLDRIPVPGSSEEHRRTMITDGWNRLRDYLTLDLGSLGTWRHASGKLHVDSDDASDDVYGIPLLDDEGNVREVVLHFESEDLAIRYNYDDWSEIPGCGLYPGTVTRSSYEGDMSDIEVESVTIIDDMYNYVPSDSPDPFHWEAHVPDANELKTYFFVNGRTHYMEGTNITAVLLPKPSGSQSRDFNTVGLALALIVIVLVLSLTIIVRYRRS